MVLSILFLLCVSIERSLSVVNIVNDGDFMRCNPSPIPYIIEDLSPSDSNKVNKLEFVQALFRHGVRDIGYPNEPQVFFPNNPEIGVLQCNISRIDSWEYVDDISGLRYRHKFVQNEQLYENSNCKQYQLLYQGIEQMEDLADIVADRYINFPQNKILFKQNEITPNTIRAYSTHYPRTISSNLYFTQQLLNNVGGNVNNEILDIMLHDQGSDPFRPDINAKCLANPEWNDWMQRYDASTNNSKLQNDFANSNFSLDVKARYESEGGVWSRGAGTPGLLDFHYCAGLDIPLSLELWKDMAVFANGMQEIWDETINGQEKNHCFHHTQNIPAYQVTLDAINDMKAGGNNAPKIFAISSHGFRIRGYLWGLNLFDDRIIPENAELTTLEIYSAKTSSSGSSGSSSSSSSDSSDGSYSSAASGNDENIEYYFRWTRRGEFIPYPACNDIYNTENTQLCDLQIMLDNGFHDAMPINQFNKEICPNAVSSCLCGLCD